MSMGQTSVKDKHKFVEELRNVITDIEKWISRNLANVKSPPMLFQASPIAASFDINALLDGVPDKHFSKQDEVRLLDIIQSTINARLFTNKDATFQISGNTVVLNYENITSNINKHCDDFEAKENVTKILNGIGSGVPDAMYLASAGLNLGRSALLENRMVFLIQSPIEMLEESKKLISIDFWYLSIFLIRRSLI